ncbi:hypothetical protein [Streptosporangium sp. NPDC049644]|uniref:hypothetical protein n=1 Tax=Streptosporangium sp. NPDC049644 TaxID=3155507 RepID=UPI00341BE4DE
MLTFSPDGATLASAGSDGAVRLWTVRPSELLRRLCVNTGEPITPARRNQYLQNLPSTASCG